MPVLELRCPDCGHGFRSLVMEGTRTPEIWVCSACGSRRAHPVRVDETGGHPWSGDPGPAPGCGCGCG